MPSRKARRAPSIDPQFDQPLPNAAAVSPRTGSQVDLIVDILERVREVVTIDDATLLHIQQQIRRDWGGDRPYIARLGECVQRLQAQRDILIRRQHRNGESINLLSRRWSLSIRRIQQIIKG